MAAEIIHNSTTPTGTRYGTGEQRKEAMGLINPVKAVMVILTYSTSKNYGVLDV